MSLTTLKNLATNSDNDDIVYEKVSIPDMKIGETAIVNHYITAQEWQESSVYGLY